MERVRGIRGTIEGQKGTWKGVENPATGAIVTGVQRREQNQAGKSWVRLMSSSTMQRKLRSGLQPVWRESPPSLWSFSLGRVPGGGILDVVQKGTCR